MIRKWLAWWLDGRTYKRGGFSGLSHTEAQFYDIGFSHGAQQVVVPMVNKAFADGMPWPMVEKVKQEGGR